LKKLTGTKNTSRGSFGGGGAFNAATLAVDTNRLDNVKQTAATQHHGTTSETLSLRGRIISVFLNSLSFCFPPSIYSPQCSLLNFHIDKYKEIGLFLWSNFAYIR